MGKLKKLVLKPTLYCFHRCKYCDLRQNYFSEILSEVKPGFHMPLEEARRLVAEAHALGMEECLLSGGDPLLYADLVPLIDFVRSHPGVFVYMNSVGTRLTADRARAILEAGLGAWNFSIDSADFVTNDRLRGVDGALAQTTRAIEIVRKVRDAAGLPTSRFRMNIQTVLTRHNYRRLPELFRFAVTNGMASVYLMHVHGDAERLFLMRADEIQDFRVTVVPAVVDVLRSVCNSDVCDNAHALLAGYFSTNDNDDANYQNGVYWADFQTIRKRCDIPEYYALIEPDGQVLPCCFGEISHNATIGNVTSRPLGEIWNGPEYARFRAERIPQCIKLPNTTVSNNRSRSRNVSTVSVLIIREFPHFSVWRKLYVSHAKRATAEEPDRGEVPRSLHTRAVYY